MIDRWLRPWPAAVREALACFEQGDAVDGFPLAYHGVGQHALWELTSTASTPTASELFVLDASECPPLAVITSQTCDLLEEDDDAPCKPWLQVAPAYAVELPERDIKKILLHQIPHLVRLTGSNFADGLFVADLRIEMPIEKSWLVGKTPIRAFETRADRETFADRLAAYKNRPAVSRLIHECIVKTVRRWFERRIAKPDGALLLAGTIAEIRVLLQETDGWTNARLIVIVNDEASTPAVRKCMDSVLEACRRKAEGKTLTVHPNEYATLDISARRYLAAQLIRLDHLSAAIRESGTPA